MSEGYNVKGTAERVESDAVAIAAPADPQIERDDHSKASPAKDQAHNWCACPVDVADLSKGVYYARKDTGESSWEEPNEPYWVGYDPTTQSWTELRDPNKKDEGATTEPPTASANSEYQGYNPKIHGSYDPNAPYAKWHEAKHNVEDGVIPDASVLDFGEQTPGDSYEVAGAFNRFTGAFQSEDQSTERHSDQAKSGRQMNAYFDVDEAANAHGGKSLRAERQNRKLSKQELAEMKARRAEKKRRKRTEWLKS
ncbi:hypothetical protein K431DRAFT_300087 [Polychaeton citri CBS 116435]|uniref:WW domain-containing protein n=1 Tax=Polychaeton citri CBS 116435 TaxID=1314669 RepID=A0A9P4QHV9_9PEZI|nr:hypothetical protein K431DRAFT_300087 [Polychaeton citri CBS 116435]